MWSSGCPVGDELCGSCKKIENIDAQIVALKEKIASLKVERVALKTARNVSHDRLVARLPLEIVSQIFQIHVDTEFADEKRFPFLRRHMTNAPLQLGAVCHTWRAIAWTSPRLWTKMTVSVFCREHDYIPELAMQWLERSGQLPLSISLFDDWDDGDGYYQDNDDMPESDRHGAMSLLHTVCKFSSRWQTLDLLLRDEVFSDEEMLQYWSPGHDGHSPNLQHLRIRYMKEAFASHLFRNFRPKVAPTIVSLTDMDANWLDINWDTLTIFEMHGVAELRDCLMLFRNARCLQDFSYMGEWQDSDESGSPLMPVTSPTLRSLRIQSQYQLVFLDYLTLPSMKNLHLDDVYREDMHSVLALIERSDCQLENLKIGITGSIDNNFDHLLAMTPSLRKLSIDISKGANGYVFAERIFANLCTHTSDEVGYMPHLEKLELRTHTKPKFSWETIPNIYDPSQSYNGRDSASAKPHALQRQSLDLQFKIISIGDHFGYIDTTSLHRISRLVEQGIQISILQKSELRWGSISDYQDFLVSSLAFHNSQRIQH